MEGLLLRHNDSVPLQQHALIKAMFHPSSKLLLLPEKVSKGGKREAIMGICNIL